MFNNKFSLANKKILVTGASSGIGQETAILLSELGASVTICGRNEKRLSDTFSRLNNAVEHRSFIGDLTDDDVLDQLVASISDIDAVVFSAGVVKTVPFKFLKRQDLQNIMQVNFESPLMLCQKLLKNKKVNKGGSIVFISSIAGVEVADKGNTAYSASKGALSAANRVLSLEVAPQKIRVNCVCPGMVWTPLAEIELTSLTPEQLELSEKAYPLGWGKPEDVAYCVSYLVSDASRWVTGTSIIIDGGICIC